MKLTPLDIRHKEFTRSMRGYKDIEVDEFLDDIVEEFERLFNENIEYKDRVEALEEKMEQYQNIEDTLKKTLVSAQQQAEEQKQNAKKEADLILRDAELKSRTIINDSYAERQKVQRSVQALKQKYDELRYQIRTTIESYMNIIDQDETVEEIEQSLEEADVQLEERPYAAPAPTDDATESYGIGSYDEADAATVEADEPVADSFGGEQVVERYSEETVVERYSDEPAEAGYGEEAPAEDAPAEEEPSGSEYADAIEERFAEQVEEEEEEPEDESLRIPSGDVDVVEDRSIVEEDPFSDLDTDSDEASFKW